MSKVFDIMIIVIETLYLYYYLNDNDLKCSQGTLFAVYASYVGLIIVLNNIGISSSFKTVLGIFCIGFIIKFYYVVSNLRLFINLFIYVVILGISELLSIGIIMLAKNEYSTQVILNINHYQWNAVILAKTLTILLLIIFKRYQVKIMLKYSIKEFLFILLPMLLRILIILVYMSVLSDADIKISKYSSYMLVLIPLLILLETTCNTILTDAYINEKYRVIRLETIRYRKEYQVQYYQAKKENENEIIKIHHNLKNYLLYFKDNMRTDVRDIDKLLESLKKFETFVPTNNDILDTLINEKYMEASHKNIEVTCSIDFSKGNFMDPLDICDIFGNLFSNAIEACEKIEDCNKRYIDIKAKVMRNFLVIKVVNSMADQINILNNYVKTTKLNKKYHGIGLLSIKESVKKYGGNVNITSANNEFSVNILIPVNQCKKVDNYSISNTT
ncbi:MAG: GHKL domain-containing protein [Anaerocolumna sp.]